MWREYLTEENEGRGVVLIGHSQGSFVLRRLLREEIEPRPEQLRRVVFSLLNFKLGKRLAARDTAGRFEKTVRRRDLARTRSKELRAVVYLSAGPRRVIVARSLPRCGVR